MKLFTAEEIRNWDQYTIQHTPIASIDLMEKAAGQCADWLLKHYSGGASFAVFCGKGNNGGDGLAIARMLIEKKKTVRIYILELKQGASDDFQTNLARLHHLPQADIHFIRSEQDFQALPEKPIIIEALFGSGLNRSLDGLAATLVQHINNAACEIVSIDIPGGLFTDCSSKGNTFIRANHTLSFQGYKPAFLFAENEEAVGEVHVLDIGLSGEYYQNTFSRFELVDDTLIRSFYKPRKKFSHKGNYGHALLIAGSYGKMGAATLSAKACMKSGVGLLTCHIPRCGYTVLQSSVPEAMVTTDENEFFNTKIGSGSDRDDLAKYNAIGIGPGIGRAPETEMLLHEIFNTYKNPIVLDADALNNIASQKEWLPLIPAGSVLTPHPKEFERLFGATANEFDRMHLAMEKAKELNCIIVLKGHHTFIAAPDGRGFFNNTGNPGMATAGSGDVLTGIITGLLAQGYGSLEAAVSGVYLHGLAGDIAAKEISMEAMTAGDIIEKTGKAFLHLHG